MQVDNLIVLHERDRERERKREREREREKITMIGCKSGWVFV